MTHAKTKKVVEMTSKFKIPSDRTDMKERSQVKQLDRKQQGNEKHTKRSW